MPTAKNIKSPAEPLGFAGLCRAMPATEVSVFAGLCQALSLLDVPEALSVLNLSTGEFLEHCQLRRDLRFKAIWDTSYVNELGRLCQGIGSGTTPTSKQVASTNMFFLVDYHDIPAHKRKEICHTMVVCEVRPKRMIPIVPASPSGAVVFVTREMSARTRPPSISSSCYSTVCSFAKARASAPSTSRNSTLIPQCPILNMSALNSQRYPSQTQSSLGLLPKGKTTSWCFQSPRCGLAVLTHGNQKDPCLSKLYIVGFAMIYKVVYF